MIVDELRAAETALAGDDRPAAIAHLVEAWRLERHVRIANLVDYATAELAPKPVPGKTVAARTKAWFELADRGDVADLPRLLATPMPKTIGPLTSVLDLMLAWLPDPRVATAFGRYLRDCVIDTSAGYALDARVIARLGELADVRTLDTIDQLAGGSGVRSWRRNHVETLRATLVAARPTEMTDDVARAIATIELRFRPQLSAANDTAGDEFLAVLHADPDNLAAYGVYGDWLVERQDPRGELIALQLARESGTASPTAEARERKLIEEHGAGWAGALGRFFDESLRVFERGFFAGGRLTWLTAEQVVEMLAEPAFRFVRMLEIGRLGNDVAAMMLSRPELSRVHTIGVLREEVARAIAVGERRPALRELHVHVDGFDGQRANREHATCEAFPNIETIALYPSDSAHIEKWCATAPVVERLTKLILPARDGVTPVLEILAARGGRLREIEIFSQTTTFVGGHGWSFRIYRATAPGPFTKIVARYRVGQRWGRFGYDLATFAKLVPATWIRDFVVESRGKVTIPSEERLHLDTTIARFTNLERREVPWEAPVVRAAPADLRIQVRLFGAGLFDATKLERVWQLVSVELGQHFDTFAIGHSRKVRAIGDDPIKKLVTWANNERASDLRLVRDGYQNALSIRRSGYTHMNAGLTTAQIPGFLDWFVRLLELGPFDSGEVGEENRHRAVMPLADFRFAPGLGWIYVLTPQVSAQLPAADVAALHRIPELSQIEIRRVGDALVIAIAPTPAEATVERSYALARALRAILYRENTKTIGFDFAAIVRERFAVVAAELGMAPVPPDPDTSFIVSFATADQVHWLVVSSNAGDPVHVRCVLDYRPLRRSHVIVDRGTVNNAKDLERVLARAEAKIRAEARAFFETAVPPVA